MDVMPSRSPSLPVAKTVDRLLRLIAFIHVPLGTIIGFPLVMLGALMAPTAISKISSVLAIAIVLALGGCVMMGCMKPDTIAEKLLRGPRIRFLLIRVPIYIFALAGITWWASYAYIHLKTEHSQEQHGMGVPIHVVYRHRI
jgi:hypothetical protein